MSNYEEAEVGEIVRERNLLREIVRLYWNEYYQEADALLEGHESLLCDIEGMP